MQEEEDLSEIVQLVGKVGVCLKLCSCLSETATGRKSRYLSNTLQFVERLHVGVFFIAGRKRKVNYKSGNYLKLYIW